MTLEKQNQLWSELRRLGSQMLAGSASVSYRKCGRAACACHHGGERHGPYLNVVRRRARQNETYYVPVELQGPVIRGLIAWRRFRALVAQLAEHNLAALGIAPPHPPAPRTPGALSRSYPPERPPAGPPGAPQPVHGVAEQRPPHYAAPARRQGGLEAVGDRPRPRLRQKALRGL